MSLIEKKIKKEFHVCDKYGYEKGFHVSFIKQEESHEVVLMCPNCGQRYKVDWRIIL